MEKMKRNFIISSQMLSLKNQNDRVMDNELEINVDVTGVDEGELFAQLKVCMTPEIRLKSTSVGYENRLDGSTRKGEIFTSPNGITVSYSRCHHADFESVLYSLHAENGIVIIQLFYSVPMLNGYKLLRNIPSISISLFGSEGLMVIKKVPLSEHPGLTEFISEGSGTDIDNVGLEHDDDIDDGVYAVPRNPDEPRVKVRKLLDYCKEKGVKPGSLAPKDMKQFLDYEKPPQK